MTRAVLAVATGLTLAIAAAPAALAQEDPTDVPPPSVVIRAISVCDGGKSGVEVILEDAWEPYSVSLTGSDFESQTTEFIEENEVHRTVFTPVPVGDYIVEVKGANAPSDGAPVSVKACDDRTPTEYELSVDVVCRGGWGVATFEVSNPDTEEVRTYSLSIENPEDYIVPVAPGMFLRITENLFDDGTHRAVLSGDALAEPIVQHFTVKCASDNQPSVFTYARCDAKDDVTTPAVVNVDVTNPNRGSVDYMVTAGDVTRVVTVAGASRQRVDLGPFPGGEFPVTVIGSDGTETPTHVVVDHCEDVKPDDDGLQIAVRCVDGESVVTVRFYAVGPYPAERVFKVTDRPEFDELVKFRAEGPYRWTRHVNAFEDGDYTATLTDESGFETSERFTVDCVEGETPTTTTAPPTTTATTAPPSTTTTAVPPQGRPAPPGDLPVTGAAVTGMVFLGLAALGLGGGLLFAARRKRA